MLLNGLRCLCKKSGENMIHTIQKKQGRLYCRVFSAFVAFTFIFSLVMPPAVLYASEGTQTIFNLPIPGEMVHVSEGYAPAIIKGLTIHPENPLEFDFIVDTGDSKLTGHDLEKESQKLIKYFMASLTVPEKDLWVNLSPYEEGRIVPEAFGVTEMGRDLLAQDYILKQLTASLIYPENDLGKEFWHRVHKRAKAEFGTSEIPMNTFNKVWIVPENALVYEKDSSAFVVDRHLKVMLEQDYLVEQKTENRGQKTEKKSKNLSSVNSSLSSELIKEIIIPEIEREVNEGKNFANLRQIYNSMILAIWYKQNLKQSLLGQVYADKNKVKGVDVEDKQVKQKIYDQYVKAFNQGVYNYIKEDYDTQKQEIIPRKYFSGGVIAPEEVKAVKDENLASSPLSVQQRVAKGIQPESEESDIFSINAALTELGVNSSPVEELTKMAEELTAARNTSSPVLDFKDIYEQMERKEKNLDNLKSRKELLKVRVESELIHEQILDHAAESGFSYDESANSTKLLILSLQAKVDELLKKSLDAKDVREDSLVHFLGKGSLVDSHTTAQTKAYVTKYAKAKFMVAVDSWGDGGIRVFLDSADGRHSWGLERWGDWSAVSTEQFLKELNMEASLKGEDIVALLTEEENVSSSPVSDGKGRKIEQIKSAMVSLRGKIRVGQTEIERLEGLLQNNEERAGLPEIRQELNNLKAELQSTESDLMKEAIISASSSPIDNRRITIDGTGFLPGEAMGALDKIREELDERTGLVEVKGSGLGIKKFLRFGSYDRREKDSLELPGMKAFVSEISKHLNLDVYDGPMPGAINKNILAVRYKWVGNSDAGLNELRKKINSLLDEKEKEIVISMIGEAGYYFVGASTEDLHKGSTMVSAARKALGVSYIPHREWMALRYFKELHAKILKAIVDGTSLDKQDVAGILKLLGTPGEEFIRHLREQIDTDVEDVDVFKMMVEAGLTHDEHKKFVSELHRRPRESEGEQRKSEEEILKEIAAARMLSSSSPVDGARNAKLASNQTPDVVGGINLDPAFLDLQIKRDGKGVPLPVLQQPIQNMQIEGFLPIIINVTPIPSLPMLLGMGDEEAPEELSFNKGMEPVDLRAQLRDKDW